MNIKRLPEVVSQKDNIKIQEVMCYATNTAVERLGSILKNYNGFRTIVDSTTFCSIVNKPNIKGIYAVFQSMFEGNGMEDKLFYNNRWIIRGEE